MAGNVNYFRMHGADSERDRKAASATTDAQFNLDHTEIAALLGRTSKVGDEDFYQAPKHPEKAGGFLK
jgi:hypothetical protein